MKHLPVSLLGLVTIAVLVSNAACSSPSAPSPTVTSSSKDIAISISGFAFAPQTIQVVPGAKVTWTNNDTISHTVTNGDTLFDGGPLAKQDTFSYTFSQPGTFEYYCKVHPSMTGRIVVQ